MTGRGLVTAWATERGFGFLCDCGMETLVDTIGDGQTPTPMEFAVTCDGCESSYWFTIQPNGEVPHSGRQDTP